MHKKLLQKSLVCLDRCHLHRSFPLCPRPVQDPQGQVMRIEATNDYVFQNLFFTTGHISTGFWAQTQHPGWKARQTEWDRFLNILSRSPVLSATFSQYCRQLDLSRNDIFWICGRCNDGRPLHLHHLLLDPGSGGFDQNMLILKCDMKTKITSLFDINTGENWFDETCSEVSLDCRQNWKTYFRFLLDHHRVGGDQPYTNTFQKTLLKAFKSFPSQLL